MHLIKKFNIYKNKYYIIIPVFGEFVHFCYIIYPMCKKKKEKVELSKKEKLKKILSIWLCSFLVLLIVVVMFVYYGYRDPYRNPYKKTEVTPTSLIEKNIIDGFKDTKDTGKFSFRLSNDDLNQMLSNVTKEDLGKRGESMYYITLEDHHYFMVDLKGFAYFKSRVVVDTQILGYTENSEVLLGINKVTTGRLRYTKTEYFSESFFDMVSEKSLLPIKYIKKSNALMVSPLKFLDYLPDGELINVVKDLVISKPSVVSFVNDSPFGFDIDLSSLRSSHFKEYSEAGEMVDLISNFRSEVPNDIYLSLEEDAESNIYNLSLDDYNKVLRYAFNTKNISETYVSSLTENKLVIQVEDIYSVLEVDVIKYIFNVSINGYMINLWVDSSLFNVGANFISKYALDTKVQSNSCSFDLDSKTGILFLGYINSVFEYLDLNTSFINYDNTSLVMSLDFSDLLNDYSGLMSCLCKIRQDNISLNKFSFFVTK